MLLDATALQALARGRPEHCRCALKACQGWESLSPERWPADQRVRLVDAKLVVDR